MTFDEAKAFLLGRARELGVDVEILANETRELTLRAFEGRLEQITQATQGGVGLRVVLGGKTGYAYSEERSEEALLWALTEAKENAELQASGDGFLPQGSALGRTDLLSEGLSAPLAEKAQQALELEAQVRQDKRVKQVSVASYSEREAKTVLASTTGTSGDYRDGGAALGTSLLMQEGKSVKEGWASRLKRSFIASSRARRRSTPSIRLDGSSGPNRSRPDATRPTSSPRRSPACFTCCSIC